MKYRHKCLNAEMLDRARGDYSPICWPSEGGELIEFGGEPTMFICCSRLHPHRLGLRFVKNLKSVSARKMRQELQNSYALSTGSLFLEPGLWLDYDWGTGQAVETL